MMILVEPVIRSLVDTLIDDFHAGASSAERAQTQDYVLRTIAGMPDYFRLGLTALAALFGLWSITLRWRPFHKLDASQRAKQVRRWRNSRLTIFGAMVTFFNSFTTLGLYSAVYSSDAGAGRP